MSTRDLCPPRATLAVTTWAAVVGVVVAAVQARLATSAEVCHAVPIHQILASAGGVYRLPDGRALKGTQVNVRGCTTMADLPTGVAFPDTNSNLTVMSYESAACVTGTGRGGRGGPTYLGFQAILVEANGFTFSGDLVVEDVDAQQVNETATGWRETVTTLAMAAGAIVRPILSTRGGSLVDVQNFTMPKASLAAVGFPAGEDLAIQGAAYGSWEASKNCPIGDPSGQCKAYIRYDTPVNRLLIVFAVTQMSVDDPSSAVFVSSIQVACGCQCGEKRAARTTIVPVEGSPGTCREVATMGASYVCDFLGDRWCEMGTAPQWVMRSAGGACERVAGDVSRPVSAYSPDVAFTSLTALAKRQRNAGI